MGIELIGLVILGFSSSVLAYLLGIGGGALIVPVMTVFLGFPVHEAIAASLVVVVVSALSITSANFLKDMVNVRFALYIEIPAVLGAFLGGIITINISQKAVSMIFALIMLLTAYLMITGKSGDSSSESKPQEAGALDSSYFDAETGNTRYYSVIEPRVTAFFSGLAGIASGMLGLGGGAFMVPVMNMIAKMPIKAATATSNFMICYTSASAAIPYLLHGYLQPFAVSSMVLGAIAGSKYSTSRLTKVKSKKIRLLFIIFMLIVSFEMLMKSVRS